MLALLVPGVGMGGSSLPPVEGPICSEFGAVYQEGGAAGAVYQDGGAGAVYQDGGDAGSIYCG